MKVAIANDHNGIEIKEFLIKFLSNKGYEVVDFGSNYGEQADYPLYAFKVGKSVSKGETKLGILICGTGIGMSIAANKIKGIMCAKTDNAEEAVFPEVTVLPSTLMELPLVRVTVKSAWSYLTPSILRLTS